MEYKDKWSVVPALEEFIVHEEELDRYGSPQDLVWGEMRWGVTQNLEDFGG